jgi:hypothetical protein
LDGLALVVGKLLQLLVLVERRVGGTEAGISGGVDALLLAVVDKLRSVFLLAMYNVQNGPGKLTKGCWGGAQSGSRQGWS